MTRQALRHCGRFAEYLLRGYSQLFLGSNPVSGALLLLGMFAASLQAGSFALLGGSVITATALLLPGMASVVRSGLVGVNGVLFGCTCAMLPEVPLWLKAAGVLAGSAVMAAAIVPASQWLTRHKSRWCLFSLPSVLAGWLFLLAACRLGHYDPHFTPGWRALYRGEPQQAAQHFNAVKAAGCRAVSFREDGLGWAAFFMSDFRTAIMHFEQAAALAPDFADPLDGLGWCASRLGHTEQAKRHFEKAIELDHWLADSWDGLGWLASSQAQHTEAIRCFTRAVTAAPLFTDAWNGLSLAAAAAGKKRTAATAAKIARLDIPREWQFTPLPRLVYWLILPAAIFIHSRISAAAVLIMLAGLFLIASKITAVGVTLADAGFLGNCLAITVALAGQYLRLDLAGLAWSAGAALLLTLTWQPLLQAAQATGLPLLALPCNAILLATLLLRRNSIPLDIAATNPETVRLWELKKQTTATCWQLLEQQSRHG